MDRSSVDRLKSVNDFDSLLTYLRDELDWPVDDYGFDDLTFQYTATELGLDEQSAAKVTEIRRLRPLDDEQPWGIFFLELEPKRLPVVALRRLLSKMTLKKRDTSNRSDSPAWHADDILFISRMGESDERHLTFAHFAANPEKADLPVLKVLGWDASDTVLRVDHVAEVLKEKLVWPEDPSDSDQWRRQWRDAFTLKHREQITTAKEMASRLAELARGIRSAIQNVLAVESENGPMTQIMGDFKKSLVHDLDPEQFADTYAQTITYGLLSARITDPSKHTLDDLASNMQTNPFLKELMESFIYVGGRKKSEKGGGLDFDELGVSDVIELLDNANMEAVVRDFGKHNQQEDPVIHFFEGFLQEYDKSIRKDRGVFYTPRPVVSFIVRSVDELLRTEFGLEDGLADITTWGEMADRIDDLEIPEGATPDQAFVQILDPATGTGTFLVEVIDLIYGTMTAKWQGDGLSKRTIEDRWNAYVPEHLLPRLHGYELMMAPYAIAHMKIGLKLFETGYRFESDERARVYLTNALEPAQDFSDTLAFAIPALAHEAEAVNAIKRDHCFTVVIGNPPYSIQSQNLTESARSWVARYRYLDGELIREKGALQFEKALQDDCIKFMGFAQSQVSHSNAGVLGFILSHSFIDSPMLRGMRCDIQHTFNSISVLDLHGNKTRKERCPDGSEDHNVFDIRQGVGVLFGSRLAASPQASSLRYAETWGERQAKYDWLAQSSAKSSAFQEIQPNPPSYLFRPQSAESLEEFNRGFKINEVFQSGSVGIITARDNLVVDFEAEPLVARAHTFRDSQESDEDLCRSLGISLKKGWDIDRARNAIQGDMDLEKFVKPLCYRPFDSRKIFYHSSLVWGMSYPTMRHMLSGNNLAMVVGRAGQVIGQGVWDILFCTRGLTEFNLFRRGGHNLLPLYHEAENDDLLGAQDTLRRPNLAPDFLRSLAKSLGVPQSSPYDLPEGVTPEEIFYYAYGLFHSPIYRIRYAEFLKVDYPRLPLPSRMDLFQTLARFGHELTALHLTEFSRIASATTALVGSGDFQVEKVSYADQTVWIDKAQTRGFRGVPEEVWNFKIGGYQVCEKWLKDRQAKGGKNPRPGRVLTAEDIEHYQKIVVALSQTIRIMAEIDEVIEAHGGWPGAFQTGDAGDKPASDVVYAEADDDTTQLDMVAEPKDG